MSKFKIESGIPVTAARSSAKPKYPVDKLQVGDSFAVPCEKEKAVGRQVYMHALARAIGIKVTTRQTEDGIRVWRVS